MSGPDRDVEATRTALEVERSQLSEQLQELTGEESGFDENFADSGQVAAEQVEARTLAQSLREQLDDVDKALARLTDGTYGQCEVCGGAISAARLEAVPTARFCIEHAG